jgi:diguanylate cyclase (GGDEF)-like protein
MGCSLYRATLQRPSTQRGPIRQGKERERRLNLDRRKRVDEMTREELILELFTDPLTGLPNRRAYDAAVPKAYQAVLDLDSLKWTNDHLGHQIGDSLLRAVADALVDAAVEAYRVSGDEFVCQFESKIEAHEKLAQVQAGLQRATFSASGTDHQLRSYQGIGITYGIGASGIEADDRLREMKVHRQRTGRRAARGERPRYLLEVGQNHST